ncbi:hypothetical protein GCM10009612_72790 [Streptomyces beijiangensis]
MATPPSRVWSVTISSPTGRPALTCSACRSPTPLTGANGASGVRRHLALHLAESQLPVHLRICQCRERSCAWHRRQGPCSGSLRLLLIRADHGRTWHLADACSACAAAIPQAATVPEPPIRITAAFDMPATISCVTTDALSEHGEWVEVQ